MQFHIDKQGPSTVAVIESGEIVLATVQDGLDLLATVRHTAGSSKVLIPKEAVAEDFFELRTGLAGEILQKFTNYGLRVAIVGDFSGYDSRALRDFIRESNRGDRVFFLPDEAQALEALHRLPGI